MEGRRNIRAELLEAKGLLEAALPQLNNVASMYLADEVPPPNEDQVITPRQELAERAKIIMLAAKEMLEKINNLLKDPDINDFGNLDKNIHYLNQFDTIMLPPILFQGALRSLANYPLLQKRISDNALETIKQYCVFHNIFHPIIKIIRDSEAKNLNSGEIVDSLVDFANKNNPPDKQFTMFAQSSSDTAQQVDALLKNLQGIPLIEFSNPLIRIPILIERTLQIENSMTQDKGLSGEFRKK